MQSPLPNSSQLFIITNHSVKKDSSRKFTLLYSDQRSSNKMIDNVLPYMKLEDQKLANASIDEKMICA
jgi:hypothetical protein